MAGNIQGSGGTVLRKGFGLGFYHPLLSLPPLSFSLFLSLSLSLSRPRANFLTFTTRCVPLRARDGQCLSECSPRQSHGNRDGFTVAGDPCEMCTGCIQSATRPTLSASLHLTRTARRPVCRRHVKNVRISPPHLLFFALLLRFSRSLFRGTLLLRSTLSVR